MRGAYSITHRADLPGPSAPHARPAGGPALLVDGVTLAAADGRLLLDGVDLSVPDGETVAIVGPNGAGKTTLLRLMSGRLAPTGGTVTLWGEPLARMPFYRRAALMAVVAQGEVPDGRLTLGDYVALGRVPHRGRVTAARHRAAVAEALERVGLAPLALRRLAQLSGGERQRGAIARALAQEPRLLLLDEPTNHLDPRARADTLALVRGLGITVVAVLHDLALVRPFASRVVVLRGGRVVASGPPAEALGPGTVRDVFAMDCFEAVNPGSGRPVLVFDAPASPLHARG